MNRKSITLAIRNKVNGWINSIQDEKVKNLVRENVIVTGGSIVSLLLNEEPNDFDIYFRTREAVKAIADYYVAIFKSTRDNLKYEITVIDKDKDGKDLERIQLRVRSVGLAEATEENKEKDVETITDEDIKENEAGIFKDVDDKKVKEYKPKYLTANAITLSDKIQLIIRFYGEPEEIHKNYDFVHCTNYWTSWNNQLVLKSEALESIITKELKYIGSKYPLCSVIRTRKFMHRGWFCSAGQYLKMLYQISKMNLDSIAVLEDQLIGVDSNYFAKVIAVLKADYEKGLISDGNIETTYLAELIDRIF